MARKKKTPDNSQRGRRKRLRAIARERVGTVKPSRALASKKDPKKERKPKHKRPPGEEARD